MQMKTPRRSNPSRTAEMRARLLATARKLFIQNGFSATSTPAIVAEARVTRGALYHHFQDKQAIFQAVIEAESAAVAQLIEAADTPDMSALQRLLAGTVAYIEAMQAPGRVRLLLVEGPAVLGRDQIRQIEAQNGDASLRLGLQEAMNEGAIATLPVTVLASILSAMFERAAMEVAEGGNPTQVLSVIEALIKGLSGTTAAAVP